jgi:hypothetical protein
MAALSVPVATKARELQGGFSRCDGSFWRRQQGRHQTISVRLGPLEVCHNGLQIVTELSRVL